MAADYSDVDAARFLMVSGWEISRLGVAPHLVMVAATTLAGIRKLVSDGGIKEDETVVAVLTGHVLKDTDYVTNYHTEKLIAPDGHHLASTFANAPIRIQSVKSVVDFLK